MVDIKDYSNGQRALHFVPRKSYRGVEISNAMASFAVVFMAKEVLRIINLV